MQRKTFSTVANFLDDLPVSDHDQILAGDTVTNLTLNYEWRRFIAYAIAAKFERYNEAMTDTEQDAFNERFALLLLDLYD